MLKMYVKQGCPFCAKALAKLDELDVQFETLDIADDANAEALVARGGKRQVPYLIDEDRNKEMYESDDIVTYLEKTYGDGASE